MNLRALLKPFVSWVVASIVVGASIGIIFGLGDTGHVAPLDAVLILTIAAVGFGLIGGAAFAPLFILSTAQQTGRTTRTYFATVLGVPCGLLGIYIANGLVGISDALAVGSVLGAIIGAFCGATSASQPHAFKSAT